MSPCPECGSEEVYEYKRTVDSTTLGGGLLPKLATGPFSSAKVLPVVCRSCGYLRFFADPKALAKLEPSKNWRRV